MDESIEQEVGRLITLINERRYPDAEELARSITDRAPDNGFVWKILSVALAGQGRTLESLEPMQKVTRLLPTDAEAYLNLGKTLRDLGEQQQAEKAFRSALRIKPEYVEAHYNLGATLKALGQSALAAEAYRSAIHFQPDYFAAHINLGNILKDLGQLEQAEEEFETAIRLQPENALAHFNLGNTLKDLGQPDRAEKAYRTAIAIRPDYAEAHSNLGMALTELGRREQAEEAYRSAVRIKPEFAEAHCHLGNVLRDFGRLEQAEKAYRTAIGIKPDFVEAYSNLSLVLKDLGRLEQAEQAARVAIRTKPDFAEGHSNLGVILQILGRLQEAEQAHRAALRLQPDFALSHSNLLYTMNFSGCHGPLVMLEEACRYGRLATKRVTAAFSSWLCLQQPERLRVGMVSGDLCNHPVAYFLESTLSRLDTERIELIAYSTNRKRDDLTSRIMPRFSAWKSLIGLSDEKAARLIHSDGVHVLIDLSGHTAHNRLPVFAWKPAPVQAAWLGYLGTAGVTEIDFLLGDPQVTPPENDGNFSESVWRLPEVWCCLTPPDAALTVAPLPALSAGCITFGSFNNLSKTTDKVVALWARVLKAVHGSRLFLKTKQLSDPVIRESTLRRFATYGIDPDRLILEGASPRNLLLEAYNRVDIALDPFPYGGATTTCEALWMAVPFITLKGDQFLSRCGMSLNTALKLTDWIADDEDDYVAKAVMHCRDPKRLAALRERLRERVLASPLFDAERFARHLEGALWGMWERRQGSQGREIPSGAPHPRGFSPAPGMEVGEDAQSRLIALFQAKRYAEAADLAAKITDRSTGNGLVWKLLAASLACLGRTLESLEPIRMAVRLLPEDAEAHLNLGRTLGDLGRPEQAEEAFRTAIRLQPAYGQAHFNLGVTLKVLGRLEQAVEAYRAAIRFQPGNAEAHSNLGSVLVDLGRLEQAEKAYRATIAIKPDFAEAHSNLILSMCYSGCHGPLVLAEEARSFGRMVSSRVKEAFSAWRGPGRADRLRVGLVSGDFRNHPVGHFLESTLSRIDPESIELFAYPTHPKTDELTSRIKPRFSAWKPLVGLGDEKAARLIHADGVQVLIDLSGHTAHNRLPVFAWKPAPVQATWLGYLGTTGVAEIDYLLGDPWATPPENDGHFSESIWRLPEVWGCFTPPDSAPAVAPLPALSAGCITFGCFNNLSKMTDRVVALWARVLKAVPGSRLFLKTKQLTDPEVGENTRQRFAAKGIAPDRLILEGASPRKLLLAAYNRVDIALDPFPYGGGTTTYETLWMAVPIVTLKGDQFLSRCGVSLATASGLTDWIADDEDDYVAKAAMHARDLKQLAALRAGLRERVLASPLFDAERFSRNLERALWSMWELWQGRQERNVPSGARPPGEIAQPCNEAAGETPVKGSTPESMRTFLHVGCGPARKNRTTRGFAGDAWQELRLDVDPAVEPDIVGTMLDMSAVPTGSVDAVFSSHNIEHLYPHQVPVALAEFKRVLKSDGFLVVTCPDLRSVCALVAQDKLTDSAYTSSAGPITPLDILYGYGPSLAKGNHFMAHRCGFTRKTLFEALQSSGFGKVAGIEREHPPFDLWALATVQRVDDAEIRRLTAEHFPT